ncbi:hypothetical protein AB0B79_39285 [Streptomyces sp. NPDC039022]|uniref:hypothetical protein n=1 Tax=unclassified Streptomyces TaxID=2593676 RepID=UPI0033D56212
MPREAGRPRVLLGFGLVTAGVGMVVATADPNSSNAARIIGLVGAVLGGGRPAVRHVRTCWRRSPARDLQRGDEAAGRAAADEKLW